MVYIWRGRGGVEDDVVADGELCGARAQARAAAGAGRGEALPKSELGRRWDVEFFAVSAESSFLFEAASGYWS